ncbi:ribonuclease H family protein [Cellulomonas aerilata]|uniref:RNase H type-1 domain-containing protein n=1 Tax=Cellulomonas aerilata TaxID=515326 RepID=A0A512DFA8_9CELL|nr:ribonuclease H [Cellulomonas aerilata]GEO34910.1 hypothetical protein CAE01nite_26350 [Cellulomonas aerilata]
MITVSTDGSCLRNPGGAIGWAWVDHTGPSASGGAVSGTNQVAELMAVHEAIEAHPGAEPLHIEADSLYAIKCASVWVAGWKRKGWRTASGGPVQNLALVQAIERAIAERPGPVTFTWVRGHVGDRFNEAADQLAGAAAREAQAGRPTPQRTLPPAVAPAAPARTTRTARGATTARTAERAPDAEVDVLF